MRYKGMLWIDGEPNRLLFQGVSACQRRLGSSGG
jgi:G3E family GTPase